MIDPENIIKFNRTDDELFEFACFCVVVAGKNSRVQAKKLAELCPHYCMSFYAQVGWMASWNNLGEHLRRVKMGQYTRIEHAFRELLKLDLRNCSLEELASIKGIGPKTARFFLLFSRPNQKYAVLDTHILKTLRNEWNWNVPKSTPSKKRYEFIEKNYIIALEKLGVTDFAQYDLGKWTELSKIK